jgi:serine/threonine protein kinase
MELCYKTLEDLIDEMQENLIVSETLIPIGYYIASQLFIEILECINYLHKHNPPFIRRDLKPVNILLKRDNNNKIILKIADFGLIALHKYAEQTHSIDKRTPKNMAPEYVNDEKYDTKADIYSSGVIMLNIFDFDFDRYNHIFFIAFRLHNNFN